MSNITEIKAREILDSRGNPTVECDITLDNNGNCWIASSSLSTDFPVVSGTQTTNNGLQDAVAFKLNSDLSSLLWSTYYGGTDEDAGYSIQLTSLNEPIITGGSKSNDLFTSPNALLTTSQGLLDGFVVKYNNAGIKAAVATW